MQTQEATLLTTTQVASMLGIHPGHLRATRSRGTLNIPFVRIGGAIRYRPADVQSFIEANRHEEVSV
jgi:excisionase family DNA binding protein